jgi:imidazolonepropionase-like amidohydrolase/ABC-type multidrug transport system permease subunit
MKTYLALILNDIRLAFRQKVVIFFNYLMPMGFFLIFATAFHAEQGGAILQTVTMVTVIGILGNGLFGSGMRAVQERETNILRRYKVAPISPLPLLVASTITSLVVYLPYVAFMFALAHYKYGMVVPPNLVTVFAFIVLGLVAVRSIGLIIASIVNSMQESAIMLQIVYMTMLFLSGSTFPPSMFPDWLQVATQFIPATHIVTGLQGILMRQETLGTNWQPVLALGLTAGTGLLLCVKLFRWEKEEKMRPAAKLWILAVILPFLALGSWQVKTRDNVTKVKILGRQMQRSRTVLVRNGRIVTGTGRVIENGAVLVKAGKIEAVYDGNVPDPDSVHAEPIEAAGKTVLPGLIDMHVHLGAPGGIITDWKDYNADEAAERELAAYLYSGVTAVRSLGDLLDGVLKVRHTVNSSEKLGAELFAVGPLFTAEGGHGTEYFRMLPASIRRTMDAQFVRTPKNAAEAKASVDALKQQGVDGIKAVMETGAGGLHFNRLDPAILAGIGAAAKAAGLPLAVHTGDARDIEDAIAAGASSIEHGSFRQRIPDEDFTRMAKAGIVYDPTLSVAEAFTQFAAGKTELMGRSLVQQAAPPKLLAQTLKAMATPEGEEQRKRLAEYPVDLAIARDNVIRAFRAGVALVAGSDAGNMLVFHGPTVQRELQLWVEAGVPAKDAIEAATSHAAKLLGASDRFGAIEKGRDATLLVVDGNPLTDIRALEAISFVMFKGERLSRSELFDQK